MRTILDNGCTWFLSKATYLDDLRLIVVEGFRGDELEEIELRDKTITDVHPVAPSQLSRRIEVCFDHIVAWQVVDESYTKLVAEEQRDDTGFLQILSRSSYLDFITQNHGWFERLVGPAAHYRLWTEDDVVDVIAHGPPSVQQLGTGIHE